MDIEKPDPCPMYWEKLSDTDKRQYLFLRQTLASPTCKNRRNRSAQTFSEILQGIKAYVVRGEPADHDRSLVCGVCWLNDKIAINTRQLRLILSKCKSSINGLSSLENDCINPLTIFSVKSDSELKRLGDSLSILINMRTSINAEG